MDNRVEEMKMIQSLNLRQKLLNQIFVMLIFRCSDAYIFVTGNITVTGGNDNTKVAFKNCALFRRCEHI